MKKIQVLMGLVVVLAAPAAQAVTINFSVEPIVGIERTQKFSPTSHTHDRFFYGARATAGIPLVAAEGEYTRGTDSETFTNPAMSTTDSADKFKVGARSMLGLGPMLSLIVRGGVQGVKNTHLDIVGATITTTADEKFRYDPYAGLGFRFSLAPKMSFTAGITAVMPEFPDMSKNEYQTSAGYSISFP